MLKYNLDIEEGSLWLRTTPTEFALKQPFYCTEVGIFYARREFNTIRDSKDSYLLFLTLEGCGIIRQNEITVRLTDGQALLMNCRSPQSYYTDPDTGIWNHYWIHIDGEGMKGLESLLIPESKITSFPASESMMHALDAILKNLESTSAGTILGTSLQIHTILSDLITRSVMNDSANKKSVMRSVDYMNVHYTETIDMQKLFSMVGMSKSYYLRKFRQYIGTTPYNYILSLRITKAKELLEVTDKTIHEIAMKTGFSDDASFSTRFSSMTGVSPLKYRKAAITRRQKIK